MGNKDLPKEIQEEIKKAAQEKRNRKNIKRISRLQQDIIKTNEIK